MKISALLSATALVSALAALTSQAHAGDFYLKLDGAMAADAEVAGASLDEGSDVGVAVGTKWKFLRLEAGLDRIDHTLNLGGASADVNALAYGGAAYLDVPITERLGLFVGAGAGFADAHASVAGVEINGDGPTWKAEAGAAIRISDNVIGEVFYRHREADIDADLPFGGGQVNLDYQGNFFGAGFRLAL